MLGLVWTWLIASIHDIWAFALRLVQGKLPDKLAGHKGTIVSATTVLRHASLLWISRSLSVNLLVFPPSPSSRDGMLKKLRDTIFIFVSTRMSLPLFTFMSILHPLRLPSSGIQFSAHNFLCVRISAFPSLSPLIEAHPAAFPFRNSALQRCVAVSNDGTKAATASGDHTVRVWAIQAGE